MRRKKRYVSFSQLIFLNEYDIILADKFERIKMTTKNSKLDEDICPLCGKPNHCEHHTGGPDQNKCWCHKYSIPREIFQIVPKDALFKACICEECLVAHGATLIKSP